MVMIESVLHCFIVYFYTFLISANCSAGTYRDKPKEKCIPCPNGEYQPDKWQLECKKCPHGNDTGGKTGSKAASDCTSKL
jgi:hypothetical protein